MLTELVEYGHKIQEKGFRKNKEGLREFEYNMK